MRVAYPLLLVLVLVARLGSAIFVQGYGIPQQCQSIRYVGQNKWPTVNEYCTSTNLALAQPLDACANITACVNWAMVPQFGGRTVYSEAVKDCRAYCSIQQSPILYSNCIDPATGAAYAGLNCPICSSINPSAYRRVVLVRETYKRDVDEMAQPEADNNAPEQVAVVEEEQDENNGTGLVRELRGKPKATTPPPSPAPTPTPTSNAFGVCGTNNIKVPASPGEFGECGLYTWNANYDPAANWAPYYTPESWSTFAIPELTVLIDGAQNGGFASYHTNFGLTDMTGSEVFSRALSLGKRIFAVQQCAKGNAACNNACTAL